MNPLYPRRWIHFVLVHWGTEVIVIPLMYSPISHAHTDRDTQTHTQSIGTRFPPLVMVSLGVLQQAGDLKAQGDGP